MSGGSGNWVLIVCCAALLSACGGKVVPAGTSAGAGGTSGDSGSSTDFGSSSHKLGPCHPGTVPATAATCPWLGDDDLCYPTVDDACNCVCPRDHASTCVSGFPNGPEGKVRVSCY